MQTNQLYLQKTGDNGFVEETGTLISASGGTVGIGTHIPASNAKLEVLGNICLTGGRLGVQTLQPQSAAEIYGTLSLNTSGQTKGLWFGSGTQARGYLGASEYAVNGLSGADFGISSAGGQNLAFGIGATEKMRLSADGRVGIGTPNPGAPLHVIGNIYGSQKTGAGPKAQMVLNYQGVGGDASGSQIRLMDSKGAVPVAINSNADTYFTGGNVGIGTSTPASLLELAGTINPELRITDTDPGSAAAATFRAENSSVTLGSHSDHSLYLVTNNSTKMTVTSAGYVGIGTTSPEASLHVSGSGKFGGVIVGTRSNDDDKLASSALYARSANPAIALLDTAGTRGVMLSAKNGGDFGISSVNEDGTALVQNVAITASGNVGIGTDNPNSVLEVVGRQTYAESASGLASSVTKSALRVKGSTDSSDSLFVGVETGNSYPYMQATNYAGTNEDLALLLNPWGGKVGIGTVSPTSALQLAGDATIDARLTLLQSTASKSGTIQQGVDGVGISALGANNPIFLQTAGAQVLNITASGDVGIGTTSPASLLELAGTTNPELRITDTAPGSAAAATFRAENSSVTLGSHSTHPLYLVTNNTTQVAVTSSGYVGIGTSNPIAKLSLPTTGVGASSADGITLGNSANTHGLNIWSDQAGHTVNYFDSVYDGADSLVRFRTRTAGTPVDALTITGDGNIGIGTTTPGHKLVVKATTSTNDGIYLTDENDNNRALLYTAGVGEGSFQLISNSNTPGVVLSTDTNDNYISNGNFGIGTISPSAKLEVIGDINASGTLTSVVAAGYGAHFSRDDKAPAIKFLGINSSDSLNWTIGISAVDGSNNKLSIKRVNDADAFTAEPFTILSDGNVGIGTSTPSGKLEIAGVGEGIVLNSPDGTKYLVTVANGGGLTTSAV